MQYAICDTVVAVSWSNLLTLVSNMRLAVDKAAS